MKKFIYLILFFLLTSCATGTYSKRNGDNSNLSFDSGFTYLAANSQFLKLGGVYVQETQNIRNRKLIHQFTKKKEHFI
jgi:hypothetical protein